MNARDGQVSELEQEVLDLLLMGPETPELLTKMLGYEDGHTLPLGRRITESELRYCLANLSHRGFVCGLWGLYADAASDEPVRAYWWQITDEGRDAVNERGRV